MTGLVIVMTGAYADKEEQTLALGTSSLEAVVMEAVDDPRLQVAREDREAKGDTTRQVTDGRIVGGTVFFHSSTLQGARFTDSDGNPWEGVVDIAAADGAMSVAEGVEPPVVMGKALLNGAPLTARAFKNGIGTVGGLIVTLAVVLFAVSTGISWSYYGDRATEYLFGSWAIPIYRWIFIGCFFMGSILSLQAVWTYGDVALGLMTLPNLIAILLLSGKVRRETQEYMAKDHKPTK